MTDTTAAVPTPVTWPAHDPATWRNVPPSSAPIDHDKVAKLALIVETAAEVWG